MHHLVRPGRARLAAATILVLVASLGACSGPGANSGPTASPGAGVTVTGAWVRNSPAVAGAVAGYFVVSNGGAAADSLLSASTPIAKTVQLHKTVVIGSAAPSASSAGMGGVGSAMPSAASSAGTGSGGMMGMVPVDRVDIPAGGSVEFKPGSYHLMIMELTGTLTVGQTVDLTLVFEKAGTITVKAEVRAS
jgi:periplasmic copper chaperone A